MENTTIKQLNWRYATKKFDNTKKLSKEQEHVLHEALRLSASSFGIQPWMFVVVKDHKLREELRKHAWGQAQITDASEIIVLCAIKDMTDDNIEKYVKRTAEVKNIPIESLHDFKNMMLSSIQGRSSEDLLQWNAKQIYIALGTLLTAAAIEHIDACPMEGFDKKKFDEVLELNKYGITAQVVCALGFRSEDDPAAQAKKVRFEAKDVFIEL